MLPLSFSMIKPYQTLMRRFINHECDDNRNRNNLHFNYCLQTLRDIYGSKSYEIG